MSDTYMSELEWKLNKIRFAQEEIKSFQDLIYEEENPERIKWLKEQIRDREELIQRLGSEVPDELFDDEIDSEIPEKGIERYQK